MENIEIKNICHNVISPLMPINLYQKENTEFSNITNKKARARVPNTINIILNINITKIFKQVFTSTPI